MKKHLFQKSLLVLIGVLITSLTTKAWADVHLYNGYIKASFNGSNCWSGSYYEMYSGGPNASESKAADMGTLTGDFKIKAVKWKINSNYSLDHSMSYLWYNIDGGSSSTHSQHWNGTNGDAYPESSSTNITVASYTNASGVHYLRIGFYSDMYYNSDSHDPRQELKTYYFKYKVNPPAVSSISVDASNLISGTGEEDDPFIIAYGSSSTLTVTAEKHHTDANSSLKVKFASGSYSATNTKSVTPTSEKQSITIYCKYNNSTASLDGAESSKTVYYIEQTPGITVVAGDHGKVKKASGDSWASSATISPVAASTAYNIYANPDSYYDFDEWTTSDGTHSSFADAESASTTVTLSAGYSAVTTVTANFKEHPYTITINGGTAASTTAGISSTIGQATVSVPFGKRFTGWTIPGSNFTLVGGTTTSSTTIKFNATAAGTVTANFAQNYAFIEGRFHVTNLERTGSWTNTFSSGDWDANSTTIRFEYDAVNHRFYRRTYATPKELTTKISNYDPVFFIKTSTSSSSLSGLGTYMSTTAQELSAAGTANKRALSSSSGSNNNLKFNSTDQTGYAVIYFDGSYIWYELEQRLKYDGNGSTSGSVASTYHARSTNATAAANGFSKTGHDFTGWKTGPSSGTSYAVGATVPISSSDVTLYAQWSPKSYDITYSPASPTNFAYTVKPSTGTYNTTVSITVTPNQNYKITSVTANRTGSATSVSVSHTSATNVYTFTQPAYGVTFNVTAASYGLSASISSKSYENRTFNLSKSSTYNPEGTLNTNWFVYYTCTAKPDGASCSINQSTGVATVDKDGDYTFKVQYRTAAAGEGTLLAESNGATGTMRTIPNYSGLTINHEANDDTYMGGDGASATPYFIYTSRATTYGKLNLTATLPAALASGETLYYSVNGSEIGTVTVDGTAASVTMDLPNKTVGAGRTAVIKFYSKLDGQVAPSAKMASATVYYTVSADPVVTISATCDDVPVVGDIPQNATIVVSASATNIPGEPTFVFKKGTGEYSSTTSYTIPEASTTMYAKTTYLGDDWTASMDVTTYATNSVTYVLSMTDLYGDDASTTTSRLFKSGGEEHTAPTIDGYTFTGWTCTTSNVEVSDNSGSTWKSSSSNATVYVRATAAGGTLTATYTANNRIYFDDTHTNWGSVYVYLFNNDVWHSTMGVQPKTNRIEWSQMTRIGESHIYYYEYTCSSSAIKYVAFSKHNQNNNDYLYATKGAYRGDFDDCTPVFESNGVKNGSWNSTNYYSSGYWRRYMPQTAPYSIALVSPSSVDKGKFVIEHEGVDEENFVKEVELLGSTNYEFNLPSTCGGTYGNTGTMTKDSHTNWTFTKGAGNCHITTTAAGIYKFHLSTADGKVKLTVDYPLSQGDYQVYYTDNTYSNNNYSNYIRQNTSGSAKKDTVSFFVKKNASPTFQIKRCTGFTGSTPNWEDVGSATAISVDRDSVYNLIFEQNGSGTTISKVGQEYYSGNYYIRTDGAAGGWMNYLSNPDNKMKHTDKASALAAGYNYYYMRYIGDASGYSTANVKFCIATDYNDCVSQEHGNDPSGGSLYPGQALTGKGANVRFTYHPGTNATTRTCIGGSTHDDQYLVINGTNLQTSGGASWTGRTKMNDLNDWIYTFELKATDDATITLESHYNNRYVTVLPSKKVLDGGDGYYDLNIIYDYKTNEVVAAYIPSTVSSELSIDVDIMFIRHAKDNDPLADAPTTTLTLSGEGKITGDPKTLYGAIKFEKDFVRAEGSYAGLATHRPQRSTYWISFPFDVRVSDIFGLGDYTETWILQRYRGDLRASRGWFLETSSFWEYIFDTDYVLEAGQGYVLSIDCEAIQWPHNQTEQYLYFPSKDQISDISSVLPSASMDVPEHECTITSPADRTVKDSHWNVIGIPGFADAWGKATEEVSVVGGDFHYFYSWDAATNTLSTANAKKFNFKFMHSYMVQYHGNINWSESEPDAVPARRAANAKPEEVEFRLELMQGEQEADHTFITLMDKEQITTGFDMNTDLVKMFNANKANIYTVINTDVQAAANCLPMTEQTTLVPVGVQVKTDGEYTFAIPEGTNGVGVTLIDNVANTHTNLGLTDYTVNLTAGTIDGRFMLEISPISQNPTDIGNTGVETKDSVRKVLIDGLLYIVKGNRIYDAQGALVK